MKKTILILALMAVENSWAMEIPDAGGEAAKLFSDRCSICHSLPHPKRLDWKHWQHMLQIMRQRMSEKSITMKDSEWKQLADYLKNHAR